MLHAPLPFVPTLVLSFLLAVLPSVPLTVVLSPVLITPSGALRPTHHPCRFLPPLPHNVRHPRSNHAAPPAPPTNPTTDVIFFSDGTNFDDVLALLYLAKHPSVTLVAIYLQGNAWASPGASVRHFYNLLHLMSDRHLDVPVLLGSYHALAHETEKPPRSAYRDVVPPGPGGILHCDTLFGLAHFLPQSPAAYDAARSPDTDDKAIPALLRLVRRRGRNVKKSGAHGVPALVALSVGTFTPLAKLFGARHLRATRAHLLPRLSGVVAMAGAFRVPGNLFSSGANGAAEFNVYNDPHAARWALRNLSAHGVPVTLVPLDAVGRGGGGSVTAALRFALLRAPATPEAQLAGLVLEAVRHTWVDGDFDDKAKLWDPAAAVVAVRGATVEQEALLTGVRVEVGHGVHGVMQGATRLCEAGAGTGDDGGGECARARVVLQLKEDEVARELVEVLQEEGGSAQRQLTCLLHGG